jgi:hypothetical protein
VCFLGLGGVLKSRGVNLFHDGLFNSVIIALDASMRLSTQNGVGVSRKSAEFISVEEEETLWEKGCLGSTSPNQLRNTLFYLNGIHFGLRGGEEQSNLLISQFTVDFVDGVLIKVD